jgi:hypothetical protein
MFRSALSRIPAIFLALAACLMTVSGPVRVVVQIEESKSEIADQIEAKEICHQKAESRRLRPKHHQHPLYFQLPLDTLRVLPVLEVFHQVPFCFWQTTPPLLRAPPVTA